MPRKKSHAHGVHDEFKIIQQCPLCEAAYEPLEAKVIDERDAMHLVHVTCRKCSHAVLALVVSQPNGLSSVGLITDADADDIMRCKNLEPVTLDDCISWHHMLKEDVRCKELFLT